MRRTRQVGSGSSPTTQRRTGHENAQQMRVREGQRRAAITKICSDLHTHKTREVLGLLASLASLISYVSNLEQGSLELRLFSFFGEESRTSRGMPSDRQSQSHAECGAPVCYKLFQVSTVILSHFAASTSPN
jgi:hypothetical protein